MAKYIEDFGLVEEYVNKYLFEKRWREIFILLCGIMRSGADKVINQIFEKIKRPWFDFDLYKRESPDGEHNEVYIKGRAAGFKVFVDCSIKIGHLVRMVVNEDSYFAYKDFVNGN